MYKLRPTDQLTLNMSGIPMSFFVSFNSMANAEIKAVIDNKKSVDEALQSMEEKGGQELMKVKAERDAEKKTP